MLAVAHKMSLETLSRMTKPLRYHYHCPQIHPKQAVAVEVPSTHPKCSSSVTVPNTEESLCLNSRHFCSYTTHPRENRQCLNAVQRTWGNSASSQLRISDTNNIRYEKHHNLNINMVSRTLSQARRFNSLLGS